MHQIREHYGLVKTLVTEDTGRFNSSRLRNKDTAEF